MSGLVVGKLRPGVFVVGLISPPEGVVCSNG